DYMAWEPWDEQGFYDAPCDPDESIVRALELRRPYRRYAVVEAMAKHLRFDLDRFSEPSARLFWGLIYPLMELFDHELDNVDQVAAAAVEGFSTDGALQLFVDLGWGRETIPPAWAEVMAA